MNWRRFWTIILILAVPFGAIFAAARLMPPSSAKRIALSGPSDVDAGDHVFCDEPFTVDHSFHLTNATRRSLSIIEAVTDCACSSVRISERMLEPGEETVIDVTLHVITPGRRGTRVTLVLDNRLKHTLILRANAVRTIDLYCSHQVIALRPGESRTVRVFVNVAHGDHPPVQPVLHTSGDFSATFSGWRRTYLKNDLVGRPNRWDAAVEISGADAMSPSRAGTLDLRVGNNRGAQVQVKCVP